MNARISGRAISPASEVSIFVGSSSEAEQRGALRTVTAAVRRALPNAKVCLWTELLINGDFTLAALLDEPAKHDFAIMLFAHDDERFFRGDRQHVTRDNVVLETGLFLQAFGHRRVAIIVERAVVPPTDLNGLIHIPVEDLSPRPRSACQRKIAHELGMAWGHACSPKQVGLDRAIRGMTSRARQYTDRLLLHGRSEIPADSLIFDSQPVQDAYEGALQNVQKSFWTTTYLTSGFWTTHAVDALRLNQELLASLPDDGSIRRLFLVPRIPEKFIEHQRLRIMQLREIGDDGEVQARLRKIRTHVENIEELNRDPRCATRVINDISDESLNNLMKLVDHRYRQGDTEIAIYDHDRVDLFSGGAGGAIDRVISHVPVTRGFPKVAHAAEAYFNRLWENASDALNFAKAWLDAVEHAVDALMFVPDWPYEYDHGLGDGDVALKDAEMAAVIRWLQDAQGLNIASYLDVGTCTGRYPYTLHDSGVISQVRTIIALDENRLCCRLTSHKLKHIKTAEVSPVCMDYLKWAEGSTRTFDLVTCMLGTMSHFGSPVREGKAGGMKAALTRMADSLNPGGALIFATWSQSAIDTKDFLRIYTGESQERMTRWSPSRKTIANILAEAQLKFEVFPIGSRLDLWCCRPAPPPSAMVSA